MELEVQKFLRNGGTVEKLETDLGIKANRYDDLVLLSYSQIDSPKTHPIVMECRGIILQDKTWNIVFKPFNRFFNHGESLDITSSFDFSNAFALEKIDGSFLGVFYYKNKWMMSTRGTIEGTGQVNLCSMTFRQLFDKVVSQYPDFYSVLSANYNYIFELTAPENRVVTPYADRSLTLLTMRNVKEDFFEVGPDFVKYIAIHLGVKYPQQFDFSDINDVVKMAAQLKEMAEGYVCVCKNRDAYGNFPRLKVKNPAYVAIAHIKESSTSSMRAFLELVMLGEEAELLSYFPEFTDYIAKIKERWQEYINSVIPDILVAKDKLSLDRKEFAEWAKTKKSPALMFLVYDKKITTFSDYVKQETEKKGRKNVAKMFMQILKIKDIEWIREL